jgi:hypothetical protein
MSGPLQVCHKLDMFPNLGYFVHLIQFYIEFERFHQRKIESRFFICIMSQYPFPKYSCRKPLDLDLYPPMEKKKLKNVDAEFQAKVGY